MQAQTDQAQHDDRGKQTDGCARALTGSLVPIDPFDRQARSPG